MGTLSTWELRGRVVDDRCRASDGEIEGWIRWGLLRDPQGEQWTDRDLERAREVRALAKEVRSLPRRALRLYGTDYPMQADKLREAMKAVAPTVAAPARKVRQVDDAARLRSESLSQERDVRRARHRRRKLPREQWTAFLDRFNDSDFERLAHYSRSEAIALSRNPAVQSAATLSGVPFEEVWLILTVMQLTVGDCAISQTLK